MKIAVYAISKNEGKFVDRWVENLKEADAIYVLDTGSTDDTVSKLKKHGVIVKQKKYDFFRFDEARNDSLNMVPEDFDICVCLDLDEVIMKGWRKKLEENWKEDTTRLRYNYNWRLDEFDNPTVNFYIEKIHKRHGYKWVYPVHEVLQYDGIQKIITLDDFTINHYPDLSKSRSSYLPLLELAYKENPDDRNTHYLGREYMYYGKYQESIDMLIKHLKLESSVWKDERCASMRFISRCYINLGRYDEANMWLEKAMSEAPYLRDPFVEMMMLQYNLKNWNKVIECGENALKIIQNPKSYVNEVFSYNETIYDLLSIAYYHKDNKEKALENVNKALEINPNNERIIQNKNIILNLV